MRKPSERGMTLAETLVAVAICGIVMVALGALASTAISQSKNQGQSVSQATALAAQKVDQLMTMEFTSAGTAAPLACATSPCGSLTTDTDKYVEYLGPNGEVVSGADRKSVV